MRLRPFVVLIAAATLSACAGSAPIAEAPPPRRPAPRPPAVRPPPPPPEPVAVVPEPAPPPPPAAPRGTVATRAYYAEADVTEWVLTNGATVVFKPLQSPNGAVALMAFERAAPGGRAPLIGNARPPAGLAELFATPLFRASQADPAARSAATYILVGDARPGDVEVAAARALVLGAGTVFQPSGAPDLPGSTAYRVPLAPESDAAVAVLVDVLRARTPLMEGGEGIVAVERDDPAGTTTLRLQRDAAPLAGFRTSSAEIAEARARVARAAREDPDFWAVALATLYQAAGDLRPARDPSFVSDFPARVARVTERALADLAARLAASPVTD